MRPTPPIERTETANSVVPAAHWHHVGRHIKTQEVPPSHSEAPLPSKLILVKPPSAHFSKNLVRIKLIQLVQLDLAKCDASRLDTKIAFLNQTYVLHLIAFWEAFIEDLARYGLRSIGVYEEAPGEPAATAMRLAYKAISALHSPKRENIDNLFNQLFQIERVTKAWPAAAAATLRSLIDERNSIAHTGRGKKALSYEKNFQDMEAVFQLANLTEDTLLMHLKSSSGSTCGA
jgi:hypothetical protein